MEQKDLSVNISLEQLKHIIENMNDEQAKYFLFKFLIEHEYSNSEIKKKFKNELKRFPDLYNLVTKTNSIIGVSIDFINIIGKHTSVLEKYFEILEKTKALSKELGLNNSLELCNLFTYLLWCGYFSKEKHLEYNPKGRKNIPGLYFTDIMSGRGVCLNFSYMLTDFLNQFDYSSATLANYFPKGCKKDYRVDINRNMPKKSFNLFRTLDKKGLENYGNHAFNLVRENNELYIYDATALMLLHPSNKDNAIIINGRGTLYLKPYISYGINFQEKSIPTLDLLVQKNSFPVLYDREDFIATWEMCLELFRENIQLLDDFYSEIENNILCIDGFNQKMKSIIRL